MKRLFFYFFICAISSTLVFSQKSKTKEFKGIVKYSISYDGNWDPTILAQQPKSMELKILGKKSLTEMILPGVTLKTINNGKDSSQIVLIDAGSYGKFYLKVTKEKFIEKMKEASPTINYLDETKQIAGMVAHKAEYIVKDEYGEDKTYVVYYNESIAGPEYNFLNNFPGLKGFPMEYTYETEEGKVTFTVTEIITKKVKIKETDFLIPSDFKQISEDELKQMFGGGEE
ncbi:MAG: hypothetical protein N2Z72_08500 [Bacteroidales bacterium]|nr:hypothetical protein [Bacteroidales bacterium]